MIPYSSRVLLLAALTVTISTAASAQEPVSFNRDVRPILSTHCFACHGPDETHRESGLRLDERTSAIAAEVIVPGNPEASGLIERINSSDEDMVMPPPHADRSLSPEQRAILKRWIAEGARYEVHWAFQPPATPTIPTPKNTRWSTNPIDAFVLSRLNEMGLEPNVQADRYTLVRRLYLDLTGLPPSIQQADEFARSEDPNAYENLVDELLASPHYGERWAQPWLDLARYSDTNGYEKDRQRSIWPYRDWVIRALNDDLHYDQFTILQLAGDMLPNPSTDAMIATGFHRNTMLNEEGGIDPLEYRYLAMVDRVATTGTVWMGLTTGCAQCHTHKYDPITHTDYYRLMALMDNTDEPDFQIPDPEKQTAIATAAAEIKKLESGLKLKFPPLPGEEPVEERRRANFELEFTRWIERMQEACSSWQIIEPTKLASNLPKLQVLDDGSIFSTGDVTKRDVYELTFDLDASETPVSAIRLEALPDARLPDRGPGRTYYEGRKGDFFVSEITATLDGDAIQFKSASHDFSDPEQSKAKTGAMNVFDGDGSTGWRPGNNRSMRLQLVMNLSESIQAAGKLKIDLLFERHYPASLGRFRFSTTSDPDATANRLSAEVEQTLTTKPREQWSPSELAAIENTFLLTTPMLAEQRIKIDQARSRIPRLDESLVMQERAHDHSRTTYRHHRGEYLSPREPVTPGIPQRFEQGHPDSQLPKNRLQMARWLVSDANPLAARVAVNRAWSQIFGAGLVRSIGDFGMQSDPPSHPGLLDWLAAHFQGELEWSQKKLHRLIVTSSTYRQSSRTTPDLIRRDPDNRWLARGPSFRVSGEMVRDISLQATGTISKKMYGPGVRPPQPASVTALAYGATKWTPSQGPDRFRRSIYTFKKRTAAFAAYTVFDGPTGETCVARRNRSNTPLQALTVLNDPMYLELAQRLAKQIAAGDSLSAEDQVTEIFRRFLTRPPTRAELDALAEYYQNQLNRLQTGALDRVAIGGDQATPGQAALAMVTRVVMNLDETITKR